MTSSPIRVACAGLAAGLLASAPVAAGLITHNLTATVPVGSYAGLTGAGTFTYEDSAIAGVGDEFITPVDGLTLRFTIFGQTFNETDDSDYHFFPELGFLDGIPIFIDFVVDEASANNPTAINELGVNNIYLQSSFTSLTSGGFGAEVFINVPEPSTYAGVFGLGVVGWGLQRMRRR